MASNWTIDQAQVMLNNISLSPSESKKQRNRRRAKKKQKDQNSAESNMAIAQAIAFSTHQSTLNPFLQAIERPMTQTKIPPPQVNIQMTLPRQILKNTSILGLNSDPSMASIHNIVEYQDIQVNTPKYKKIAHLFPPSLTILKIQQVFNPFLRLSFQLTQHFKYAGVKPMALFHGTKLKYVHSICSYNFDWRFSGAEKGHKYGMGVNFTPNPKFSIHFCQKDTAEKVVILADVLVGNTGLGSEKLEVPPPGYDTTIRDNKSTYVKFDDAEFYPKYVIFFRKR